MNTNEYEEVPQEMTPVQQAKEILAKLQHENKIMAENLVRAERLRAEAMLSGQSVGGKVPPQEQEETPAEYTKRLLRGDFNGPRKEE